MLLQGFISSEHAYLMMSRKLGQAVAVRRLEAGFDVENLFNAGMHSGSQLVEDIPALISITIVRDGGLFALQIPQH